MSKPTPGPSIEAAREAAENASFGILGDYRRRDVLYAAIEELAELRNSAPALAQRLAEVEALVTTFDARARTAGENKVKYEAHATDRNFWDGVEGACLSAAKDLRAVLGDGEPG